MFDRYQAVIERHKTSDLSDSQPTKGNIEGGLTTIEEKALGNIQKIGRKCLVDGVIDKAETPTGPGPVVHGLVVGRGGDAHAPRGRGLRRALLPHRAGQRDRQSHPAGDQALRQPAHGAHHERAHRRGRLGAAAQGNEHWTRRATRCSTACSAPPTAASPPPRRSATASSCSRASTRAPDARIVARGRSGCQRRCRTRVMAPESRWRSGGENLTPSRSGLRFSRTMAAAPGHRARLEEP